MAAEYPLFDQLPQETKEALCQLIGDTFSVKADFAPTVINTALQVIVGEVDLAHLSPEQARLELSKGFGTLASGSIDGDLRESGVEQATMYNMLALTFNPVCFDFFLGAMNDMAAGSRR